MNMYDQKSMLILSEVINILHYYKNNNRQTKEKVIHKKNTMTKRSQSLLMNLSCSAVATLYSFFDPIINEHAECISLPVVWSVVHCLTAIIRECHIFRDKV